MDVTDTTRAGGGIELDLLRDAVLGFAGSRDLAIFWDLVCANSRTLLPARRMCALLLSDFNLLYLQAGRDNSAPMKNMVRELPAREGELHEAMRSEGPVWLENIGTRVTPADPFEDWLLKDEPANLLLLPVRDEENVTGSLIFAMDALSAEQKARLESAGRLYALHVSTAHALLSAKAGLEVANRLSALRNEELTESRTRLREMNRELEEADLLKQEFLSNMSHELRTPLNSVIGFSDLLSRNRQGNLTEKDLGHVEKINRNGKYLLGMINNLLDFSRLQAGEMDFEPVNFSVKEAIIESIRIFEPIAAQKDIDLHFPEDSPDSTVHNDPERFKQILVTLMANAIKFVKEGEGRINLYMENTPGGVRVVIEDNGVGIPLEKIQVIMEPFRQADGSSTRNYGGLGLGLSIARKLMEAMGGELQVESTEGKGSRFSLLL